MACASLVNIVEDVNVLVHSSIPATARMALLKKSQDCNRHFAEIYPTIITVGIHNLIP